MSKLPPDIAIRVDGIHKDFHLPHHNEDSLKSKIITAFEKKDKEIDTQHALRGISFDIKKGEFYGVLGRNGSGKSTLLKIISEIYQPTKGKVQRQGSLVAFIELGVGFNPQLSGRENVYLNAALLGFSRKEIDGFYDKVVSFAELEDHMEQKLKNYSSGMKVRLAFAVAIQAHADILVLDEVLAVGDADFQRKCYNYFKELKDENKTIVFVSHSMGLVKEYCDKAILIEDGKIAHQGPAEDIADEYLKMFNKSKSGVANQTSERWGSEDAVFQNVKANLNTERLQLEFDIKCGERKLYDTIIAVDFYDEERRLVGGIDDTFQRKNSFNLEPGETINIMYEVDNIFGGGRYTATVSLKSRLGNSIYDFWKNAFEVDNPKNVSSYFPVVFDVLKTTTEKS